MRGVQVFGEIELIERIGSGEPHYSHCISIRNPHEEQSPEIAKEFTRVLELKFYDIEGDEFLPEHLRGHRMAQSEDLQRVIQFVGETLEDSDCSGYTIHCARGVSRSAAVALGVLYLLLGSERDAIDYLRSIRPTAMPLPRILRFWDHLLGTKLVDAGEWIRYRLYQEMQADLAQINDSDVRVVTFEQFREMRQTMEAREKTFMEEFESAD